MLKNMKIAPLGQYHRDYMSPQSNNTIKGIFILLILLSHYTQYCTMDNAYDIAYWAARIHIGQGVVAMFMFYSGYGMMESIGKKGLYYVKRIPAHRLLKVWGNFVLAVFCFFMLDTFLGITYPVKHILLSLIGWKSLGNSDWYMFAIFSLYVFTFFAFLVLRWIPGKKGLIAGNILMYAITIGGVYWQILMDRPAWAYNTMLLFPLGMSFSLLRSKAEDFVTRGAVSYLLCCVITGLGYMYWYLHRNEGVEEFSLWVGFFTAAVVLLTMKVSFRSWVLEWCGKNLFWVYILQRLPMIFFDRMGILDRHKYFTLILVALITVLLTHVFTAFTKDWQSHLRVAAKRLEQGTREEKKGSSRKSGRHTSTLRRASRFLGSSLFYIFIALLLLFFSIGRPLVAWCRDTFQTSFREIIYTFNLGLTGADFSFFKDASASLIRGVLLAVALLAVIVVGDRWIRRGYGKRYRYRVGVSIVCITLAMTTLNYADETLQVKAFLKSRFVNTHLYEESYIDARTVDVRAKGKTKNLILIYLESMEITYADQENGGIQEVNLMPRLSSLAKDNIAFGDPGVLSGTHNVAGTTWTTGAILATSAGIPFAFRQGKNAMAREERFAPGVWTLGDFLEKEGYQQAFLCGSDAEFGAKREFFEQHGDYDIVDYYQAIERGYIEEGYKVWWGMEDHYLYEMAKDELLDLASDNQPFNLTMLTVDTHHVGGYHCAWCGNEYDNDTANVIACADRQLGAFIDWCSQQDFFEDTAIVILGDHPRMDQELVYGVSFYERAVYNCFINADIREETINRNRIATSMDIYPTILYALGYDISGDRLALGTNLFSGTPTLAEEMGYRELDDELGKNSDYYQENFAQ